MPQLLMDEKMARREFWRAQAVGWTLLGMFGFCIRLAVFNSLPVAVVCTLVVDTVGFLMTSLLAQQPFARNPQANRLRSLALAAFWCVFIAALMALLAYELRTMVSTAQEPAIQGNEYVIGFIYYVSIITAWTLAFLGVRAEAEARAQRMQAMAAQTRALRLEVESLHIQIEPHFLFNALNTIVAEIGDRPAIAEEMTRQLAAYLRYSLQKRDQAGIVADELEAVGMYFRIQALRFDERFIYHCTADPAALSASIPHMAIQCLVENAIKHGLLAVDSDFTINVKVTRNDDELEVVVDNPSSLKVLAPEEKMGTGLSNLKRRLDLRYPGRNRFSLSQREGRTYATLNLKGEPCSV